MFLDLLLDFPFLLFLIWRKADILTYFLLKNSPVDLFQHVLAWAFVLLFGPYSASGYDVTATTLSDVFFACRPFAGDISNSSISSGNASDDSTSVIKGFTWITPSAQTITDGTAADDKNYIFTRKDSSSTLRIEKLKDSDFGDYFCVCVWSNFTVSIIRHSLIKDGASRQAFHDQHVKNILIGASCAGGLLLVILIAYVIWRCTCSERVQRRKRLTDDLARGANRFSTEIYDNVGFEHYVKKREKQ